MDYDLAIFVLCDRAQREKDIPADPLIAADVSAETLRPPPLEIDDGHGAYTN